MGYYIRGGGYEFGLSVDVCSDGGYILAGPTQSYGQPPNKSDWLIIKVDNLGNKEWDTIIGGSNDESPWNVQQTSDGGYIIGGFLEYDFLQEVGKPYLVKLDSEGNTEWDKTYGAIEWNTTLFMVRELPDGSFIAAGQVQDALGWLAGLVLKVNAQGDSLWYRLLENLLAQKSDNKLRDIRPTSDGGFIATGWVSPDPPDTGSQDMWVIKLDSCGCLYAGCDSICQGLVGIEEIEIPGLESTVSLTNYPNPFTDGTIIEAFVPSNYANAEIIVYDIIGNKMKHYSLHSGTNLIELRGEELDYGIYFYSLIYKGGKLETKKMIHIR